MLLAVEMGGALHASGNIKASGASLEDEIRKMLSESLPSTNKVATGYFYDASSKCSNEVDVLVYEAYEAFRLDPAPGAQHYIPYTSVSIIGQVKNSSKDLSKAIEQVQNSVNTWREMRKDTLRTTGTNEGIEQLEPLTFIVCGKSNDADMKKLGETLKSRGAPYVDYILFLDRGEIVAGYNDLFTDSDQSINFLQYGSRNTLHLCKPVAETCEPIGVALLWLYFALVYKLDWDKENRLRYHSFCRQIERLYCLRPVKELLRL